MKSPIKIFISIFLLTMSFHSKAALNCSDVTFGTDKYPENMEILHNAARLKGDHFNRYHESVVEFLCKGDAASAIKLADDGYLLLSEVVSISEVLGLEWRSDLGQSFGFSKEQFVKMGLGLAPADNVARYYAEQPQSRCGQVAKRALEGNPRAIELLVSFPSYCKWPY